MNNLAVVFRESEDEVRPGELRVCDEPKCIEVDMSLPFEKMLAAANCGDIDPQVWRFVPKTSYKVTKKQQWSLFEADEEFAIDECEDIVEKIGGPSWRPAGTRQLLAFAGQAEAQSQQGIIIAPRSHKWLKSPGRPTFAETKLNLVMSQEAREETLRSLKTAFSDPHRDRAYDRPLHEDPAYEPYTLQLCGGGPVRRLNVPMARGKFPRSVKILGVRTVLLHGASQRGGH